MESRKTLIAMSGGVDSSVAAFDERTRLFLYRSNDEAV